MDLLAQIEKGVNRILNDDCNSESNLEEIASEINKRQLSYTGEEIARPEELVLEQVLPGLPPRGQVPVVDWVSDSCLWYLNHPEDCLVEDTGQELPKLQAKVHVAPENRLPLAQLLVQHNICCWIKSSETLRYRNQEVLSGLFAVDKSKLLPDGRPIQRVIMNLIPTNAIHRLITGRVSELPHITRWCSVVLTDNELLHVCQSDMASAFYLFNVPTPWHPRLAFNLKVKGCEIGLTGAEADTSFTLASRVLPMGWASAVGIMQFIAEEVLYRNHFDAASQIRKRNPLPKWMVDVCSEGEKMGKLWWHVYLDNYASGEITQQNPPEGDQWQCAVESIWENAGIVVSKDKSVCNATEAQELGAFISGRGQWVGASPERLLKVIRTTLFVVSLPKLQRKTLQVLMGRWIFILQFRRPGMAHFEKVWEYISGKIKGQRAEAAVRQELFTCILGSFLFHTYLGNQIDNRITCSDASNRGGAIAEATSLTPEGKSFLSSKLPEFAPQKIPIYVVSLFNGVGGCFRCFDLAGLSVCGAIACDISSPAQRVTSRRWPWVSLWGDITTLDKETLRSFIDEAPPFSEIHVWAGFPCVDLSSAKAHRLNLQGPQSSLIHEAIRVIADLRGLYPSKTIHFVIENVASMDPSARTAISQLLNVAPYKVDPSNQVPMSRPRLCWTTLVIPHNVAGVTLVPHGDYTEVVMEGVWPQSSAWLEKGAQQNDPNVMIPRV